MSTGVFVSPPTDGGAHQEPRKERARGGTDGPARNAQ